MTKLKFSAPALYNYRDWTTRERDCVCVCVWWFLAMITQHWIRGLIDLRSILYLPFVSVFAVQWHTFIFWRKAPTRIS